MKTLLTAMTAAALLAPGLARAADEKITVEKFYATKCASCHGKDGKGNEKMAKMLKTDMKHLDLVGGNAAAAKDEEVAKEILEGEKKMPAFKAKMGGLDVAELVKYIRSLKPAEAPKGK